MAETFAEKLLSDPSVRFIDKKTNELFTNDAFSNSICWKLSGHYAPDIIGRDSGCQIEGEHYRTYKAVFSKRLSDRMLYDLDDELSYKLLKGAISEFVNDFGKLVDTLLIHGKLPDHTHLINKDIFAANYLFNDGVTNIHDTDITADAREDDYLNTACDKVREAGYDVDGIAIDPSNISQTADIKIHGRKVQTRNVVNGEGVCGPTDTIAIVGDFYNGLVFALNPDIDIILISAGDPDGKGDLKQYGDVCLRLEVVFYVGVKDTKAFAIVS